MKNYIILALFLCPSITIIPSQPDGFDLCKQTDNDLLPKSMQGQVHHDCVLVKPWKAEFDFRNPNKMIRAPNVYGGIETQAALQWAVHYEDREAVKEALGWPGVDVNVKNLEHGETALMQAVWLADDQIAQLLLEKDANPNEIDKNGATALHVARSFHGCAAMLLAHGANPKIQNRNGRTPLHNRVSAAECKMLLEHGSDVNVQAHDGGDTPLHSAIEGSGWLKAKLLLCNGADTTLKDDTGEKPLKKRMCGIEILLTSDRPDYASRIQAHKQNIDRLDEIFDALQPAIDARQLSDHEQILVSAYDQMLQGKHDELRNQLLVLPDALQRRGVPLHVFSGPIYKIFKRESIKPLLYFLAEKQYQRTMADAIAPENDVAK